MKSLLPIALLALSTATGQAQSPALDPNIAKQRDIILGRATLQEADRTALDRFPSGAPDGKIDVRDMALYINGKPLEATFGSTSTPAFPSQGSVQIPIFLTKPVTGTLRFELSGTAVNGADFNASGIAAPSPVAGLNETVRQVTLTNQSSTTLTVPLLQTPGEFRGERRLVLTLRTPGTLSGSAFTPAGPLPGQISSHTIIISEAEKLWVGTLDFTANSGFGKLPVTFALSANGTLRAAIRDSKFFAGALPTSGSAPANGALSFSGPLTGNYSPAFEAPTASGPPATWRLTVTPASAGPLPVPLAPIFDYTAQLEVSNFPVAGVLRSHAATLSLTPSR